MPGLDLPSLISDSLPQGLRECGDDKLGPEHAAVNPASIFRRGTKEYCHGTKDKETATADSFEHGKGENPFAPGYEIHLLTDSLPGPDGGVLTLTERQGQHAEQYIEVRHGRGYAAREDPTSTFGRNLDK